MLENEKNRFNGNDWYRRLMDKRTRAALREQSEAFELDHADDSDEELLQFVLARSKILGHAPQMCEVTGARMIVQRFGSWAKVIHAIGYQYCSGTRILERSQRYRFEYARQQSAYRAERREKNEQRIKKKKSKKPKTPAHSGD